MKKIFISLIAIVLVFSFTACDITISPLSNKDPAPVVQPEPAPVAEPAPEPTPPVANAEPAPEPAPKSISYIVKDGIIEAVAELDAGEYVFVGSGSFSILTDEEASFDTIVVFDNIYNRTIFTVKKDEYLEFSFLTSGILYPIDDAPPVDLSSGKLDAGMYLVGKDFKAGEYKLVPEKNSSERGFVEIAPDSRHDAMNLIDCHFFETEEYITVRDGQYIKITHGELVL